MAKWKPIDTVWGYEPLFEITCRYCNVPLQARFSTIYNDFSLLTKYKCPSCGWFAGFEIDGDKEHHKHIFEMRGEVHTITPTMEELKEDEEIARQLEGLGYFGGRND